MPPYGGEILVSLKTSFHYLLAGPHLDRLPPRDPLQSRLHGESLALTATVRRYLLRPVAFLDLLNILLLTYI